jgi:hypothetical protein
VIATLFHRMDNPRNLSILPKEATTRTAAICVAATRLENDSDFDESIISEVQVKDSHTSDGFIVKVWQE